MLYLYKNRDDIMNKKINNFLFFIALFILYAIYSTIILFILSEIQICTICTNGNVQNAFLIINLTSF